MSAPPPDRPDDGTEQPISLNKPDESGTPTAEPDFDPYRFGAPDHPIPPEYAPPGYKPPQPGYPGQRPPAQYGSYVPPPYQPGPPPPPYAAPYAAHRRSTGKAIASLVLGIGSIVLSILSIFDIVLIALAVIFGVIALVEANRGPTHEGRGMAIAGLICAGVGAILAVLLTIWFVNAARHCTQYDSGSSQFQSCFRDHL